LNLGCDKGGRPVNVRVSNEDRTGGQILVDCLRGQGVAKVFCVPGESYIAALDALYEARDHIELVVCRQEGGVTIMGDAYGKMTGEPGVCFVTRGPGAANASTGIHTAFQDSTPLVLFVGQVSRRIRDREGFQEVDLVAMFSPLAKWAAEINDPRRIPEYVHRAFQTALSGRPGPVVLSLPEDILSETIEAGLDLGRRARPIAAAPRADQMAALSNLLDQSSRPLLLVGGGGWSESTGRDALAFAEASGVPIASSLRCQDYVDNTHPSYIGHLGVGAEPSLAARVKEVDLLIALGARLGEMTTAGYTLLEPPTSGRTLVHVHPDPNELGRVYQADLPINAASSAFAAALAALPPRGNPVWTEWRRAARADFEESLKPLPQPGAVNLGEVMTQLQQACGSDAIVCSGAGNYTAWAHRHWMFRRWRSQLAPTSGAMGYGVPSAVAAALVCPQRTVISISGDGCFLMHGQELATAVRHGVKVLFLVVNNGVYGTIRMHQERLYPGRVVATDLVNPDFTTLASAYGIVAERVTATAQFAPALERALKAAGSALIEIVVDPEAISVRSSLSQLRARASSQTGRSE
jgi:acetolactate synthase I/II/III large subunit